MVQIVCYLVEATVTITCASGEVTVEIEPP